MEYSITTATPEDAPLLVNIINQSYRGETSKQGWTTEAFIIDGDKRTDIDDLLQHMHNENAIMLKAIDHNSVPVGCIYLERSIAQLHFGMLSVLPSLQQKGIGGLLLQASETYARQHALPAILLHVISIRTELINWYRKKGYKDTGRREAFPSVSEYGQPRQPLEFIIMEKIL